MSTDTFAISPADSSSPETADALDATPVHADVVDSSGVVDSEPLAPEIVIVQTQPLPPVERTEDDATTQAAETDASMDEGAIAVPAADPLPQPREPRIIAMINQKGGVGKTTSTVNLGAGLSYLGYRVLLIDLDPQAHMTLHLGIDPATLERSNYDLLTDDDVPAIDVVQRVTDNLFVLPAEVNLAGAETEMAPKLVTGRAQRVLKDKLAVLMKTGPSAPQLGTRNSELETSAPDTRPFDYILLDCPPSLGLLTINALTFAKEVFVPMQAHFLALQGLSKLLETVGHIRGGFNTDLQVTGVVLCMHEKQTLLAAEVAADLNGFLDGSRDQDVPWRHATVLTPSIRRNIKLAESPSFGTTIFEYAPDSNGAEDYRKLAMSVVKQGVALGK